ncbi:hypothetical protein SAMN04487896_1604 [Paenibacillus sp. ov031]|uniref:hypothetical protein n=1 Tax=Paenibacillus sp. ov031 TaxID=1761879 RepID=UPI00090EC9A8|nr:hypothetical protein [Paenibacillus sp. ov031]SHN61002.1 hypothetical protein SAMN04487896_1604 [Paenibacillus sp. ov031]
MAKTNEIRLKAKRYKARPVCVTLHSGETYIGYISDVNSGGVVLTGGGKISRTATTGDSSQRSKQKFAPSKSGRSQNRKRVNDTRKPSTRSSTVSRAQVSSFLPMMGSLFGGLGGAASAGGMLGGGMRIFGMIQQFMPVMKMGYGMIKSIHPFMGAVKGLMAPPSQAEEQEV